MGELSLDSMNYRAVRQYSPHLLLVVESCQTTRAFITRSVYGKVLGSAEGGWISEWKEVMKVVSSK